MQNVLIRTVALPAAAVTTVASAWSGRKVLRIINIGINPATLGTVATVAAGDGWPLDPAGAVGGQGGGIDFEEAPDAVIYAISTAGTTLCVMEG
jgi:hypothetical protein